MYDLFGNLITNRKCRVTVQNGALQIITPYNQQFVALVKSLPAGARRFDPANKAWLVDTQYSKQVRDYIKQVYNEDIGDISVSDYKPQTETRVLDIWYIGRTKPSGDEYVANAMNANKEWAFIFPERVLKEWFEGVGNIKSNSPTLYGVLGVHRNASLDEIKSAYRRLVKQWHPDVCKEPDAQETFIKIKEAYEILSVPTSKAKYDAGLSFEASLQDGLKTYDSTGYRSPLRCGYVLAEGYEQLGRFVVEKIIDWRDIETDKGTLTASWPAGANQPVWTWI